MFESRAIIRYLVHAYPKQAEKIVPKVPSTLTLSPTSQSLTRCVQGNQDFANVEAWLNVESENFNGPISALVFEYFFKKWARDRFS